jgi:hypothetical protein
MPVASRATNDLVTRHWRTCRVLQTFTRLYQGDYVSMTVGGETIESTFRHPYWVVRGEALAARPMLGHLALVPVASTTPGRWVDAGDLRVGDQLLLKDGRIAGVEQIRQRQFHDHVYNFEVEDLHCYTVGRSSVLVHNNSGPGGTEPSTGPFQPPPNSPSTGPYVSGGGPPSSGSSVDLGGGWSSEPTAKPGSAIPGELPGTPRGYQPPPAPPGLRIGNPDLCRAQGVDTPSFSWIRSGGLGASPAFRTQSSGCLGQKAGQEMRGSRPNEEIVHVGQEGNSA